MEIPQYSICPTGLLTNDKIKDPKSIILLGLLANIANAKGQVDLTNDNLAKLMNCSSRTLQRNVVELKQAGYIKTAADQQNNRIIIVDQKLLDSIKSYSINQSSIANFQVIANTLSVFENKFNRNLSVLESKLDQLDKLLSNYENLENTQATTSKEKIKRKTPYDQAIDQMIDDENVKAELYNFIQMRRQINRPMTVRAVQIIVKKLYELSNDPTEQAQILDQSIINNWIGVYPLNDAYRDYQSWQGNGRKGVTKEDVSDFEGL